MEIVTARSCSSGERPQQGRRRKASDGHVVAQLLDSPLPTPRRSCCGSAADTPRSVRGAGGASSPQRTYVPFSWESSPGVPKVASGGNGMPLAGRDVMPPRPPPGRGTGIGMGTPWHYATRASYHGQTTTDATSSAGGDDDDTFSDALDRISSSDRLAALSARLSSIDGRGGASRRLSSFIMDRFLPAANAIATTSTEIKKRDKKSPCRRRAAPRSSKHEDEEAQAPATVWRETHTLPSLRREQNYQDADHTTQHAWRLGEEEARGDDETSPAPSPRACGFLVLFPWSVKPVVLCGFPRSPAPARPVRTPRADAVASPPRRSTTLGDVLVKESRLRSGIGSGRMSHWYEEKSGSGKEWSSASAGPGLGRSILGTSKRYCADARKALSRLARSATDNGGGGGNSPRIGRERRSGKPADSTLGSTSGRMPQLKPPSESWLSHARGSNAVNNRR